MIVVGAGLAGLSAADALLAEGVEVTVLEARHRVGGRVLTHRDGFVAGQCAEGGAEWVSSDHTEVLSLVERLGLDLLPTQPSLSTKDSLLDAAGKVARFDLWDRAAQGRASADIARWHDACLSLATRLDPRDPAASAVACGLDDATAADLIDELNLHSVARMVVGRRLRTEFMVTPADVSQAHLAWMTLLEHEAADGYEAFRIGGGNDQLATGLAAHLGERVRLNTPVSAVRVLGVGVSVTATSLWNMPLAFGDDVPGSTETLGADAVVLAVPLPVLSRMYVDPSLPAGLAASYGIGGKVSVQFDRRSWRDQGHSGSVLSDRAYGEIWETSQGHDADEGVLTALLSSHDSAAILSFPDATDRVAREMIRIYPDLRGFAGTRSVSDWTNDPQSLGTYAAFAPGELTRLLPLLRADYGRIALAGEHMDRHAGFMEGALRSGRAAADRLLNRPRSPRSAA